MSSPNLLITGVTGFLGFKVLTGALQEGYTVRAAVRSIEKAKTLSSHPKIVALGKADKLSFVEVPDICAEGAYDQAIKGVTYVIHHASPLPSPFLDPQTGIYEPNIKSASTILNSALKEPSVKKVIITSSVFANSPFPPDPTKEITAESRVPDRPGPFTSMIPAYSSSKVAALNATDKFSKEKQPKFAIVNIFPGFLFGFDDRALSAQDVFGSTNRLLLSVITGNSSESPMPSGAGHVADVAKIHLLALKDGAAKNIGATVPHQFDDAWTVVQKRFPKAVADGVFTKGSQPTVPVNWNAHKTEVDLGFNFKTYEDAVVEVAGQYLELSGKEKA
ncbi:putative cinnamoyl-CoA reductase [Annulohypoxylon nitens]|nr:putative cinnamoyl-CoA reductase [Annulohypoxylon nitens]